MTKTNTTTKHENPTMNQNLKRVSGMLILNITEANPNGDPDYGNRPRTFRNPKQQEMGYITPIAIMRKLRNVFADHDSVTFKVVTKELGLDKDRFHILETRERGFPGVSATQAVQKVKQLVKNDENQDYCPSIADRYWDYRIRGTTLLESPFRHIRTGCLSFSPPVTVAPMPRIVEATITKPNAFMEKKENPKKKDEEEKDENSQTMGPSAYKFVPHALYVCRFEVNPHHAHRTGLTEEDVRVLKAIFPLAFELDTSAARPAGSVRPVHIWWKEHDKSICSFDLMEFWANLLPKVKSGLKENELPASLADYDIPDGTEFGAEDLMKNRFTKR